MKPSLRKFSQQSELWINTLLDMPDLSAVIQTMTPEQLLVVVKKNGLEESAELLAQATPEQLSRMLDEDLWKSPNPGQDQIFDSKQFSLWMNVLNDMGPKKAAEKIAAMDSSFLAMAFSGQIQVFKTEVLQQIIGSNKEQGALLEKLIESRLNYEFSEHIIIARSDQSWDSIIEILMELDQERLTKLLDHLAALSDDLLTGNDQWEELLSLEEQLENDFIDDREKRREALGYITPRHAALWLTEVRQSPPKDLLDAPVPEETRDYFEKAAERQYAKAANNDYQVASSTNRLFLENQPGLIKKKAVEDTWIIHDALYALAEADRQLYSRRMEELIYLSNLLMAGCTYQNRAFHQIEAAQAVFSLSNLGLDYWLTNNGKSKAYKEDWLKEKSIVTFFRTGMSLSHQTAMLTAKVVCQYINKLPESGQGVKGEKWIKKELLKIKTDLEKGINLNRPWLAAEHLILLETIMEAGQVAVIMGLISEFPLWITINPKTNQPEPAKPINTMKMLGEIKDLVRV